MKNVFQRNQVRKDEKEALDWQTKALDATRNFWKGIIQAPTGCGKSFLQSLLAIETFEKNETSIIIVRAPRILLSNQLVKDYRLDFDQWGVRPNQIDSISFHSGAAVELEVETEEEAALSNTIHISSTTNEDVLMKRIRRAKARKMALIIAVTYHSSERLNEFLVKNGIQVDLDINDEAHFLVQNNFHESIRRFPNIAERQYFFTATPRYTTSLEGRGMDNVNIYGPVIIRFSVKEMVDAGIITPLQYATITSSSVVKGTRKIFDLDNFVVDTLAELRKENNGCDSAKLLVATEGTASIGDFLAGDAFIALQKQGVNIITVSSAAGTMTVNGDDVTKEVVLVKLKEFGRDNKDLIVMHFDMLSEGIDVPGLNGVLILRNMGDSKFFQTIGRVIRKSKGGTKNYGMLYFPNIDDVDMAAKFTKLVKELRKDGYFTEETLDELRDGAGNGKDRKEGDPITTELVKDLIFEKEVAEAAVFTNPIF